MSESSPQEIFSPLPSNSYVEEEKEVELREGSIRLLRSAQEGPRLLLVSRPADPDLETRLAIRECVRLGLLTSWEGGKLRLTPAGEKLVEQLGNSDLPIVAKEEINRVEEIWEIESELGLSLRALRDQDEIPVSLEQLRGILRRGANL